MKTPFLKGLSWLIILNLVIKPAWIFFIDRQVQNIIGHEAYGKYFAAFGLAYILSFIGDAGLSNMMNRKIANQQQVSSLYYLKLKLFFSATYLLVACMAGWIVSLQQWEIYLYIIVIQLLASLLTFFRSLITAHQSFVVDAWLSVLDKTLVIVFCTGFIYLPLVFGAINLFLFLKIQLISLCAAVALALFIVLKRQLLTTGNKESFLATVKAITPFALIIMLMSVHYRIDGFLLERMHANGAYEAGIYASGYRLLDAAAMVGNLSGSFLVPFIARNLLNKKMVQETIYNTSRGLLLFGGGVLCVAVVFAPLIQKILYHTEQADISRVIQLCVAALPAYLITQLYGAVLTATAHFRSFILIILISVFINVLLNVFLIPSYGAVGCCISALISQYICATCCYITAMNTLNTSITGNVKYKIKNSDING